MQFGRAAVFNLSSIAFCASQIHFRNAKKPLQQLLPAREAVAALEPEAIQESERALPV
jgi:hypothetical protein